MRKIINLYLENFLLMQEPEVSKYFNMTLRNLFLFISTVISALFLNLSIYSLCLFFIFKLLNPLSNYYLFAFWVFSLAFAVILSIITFEKPYTYYFRMILPKRDYYVFWLNNFWDQNVVFSWFGRVSRAFDLIGVPAIKNDSKKSFIVSDYFLLLRYGQIAYGFSDLLFHIDLCSGFEREIRVIKDVDVVEFSHFYNWKSRRLIYSLEQEENSSEERIVVDELFEGLFLPYMEYTMDITSPLETIFNTYCFSIFAVRIKEGKRFLCSE